jgi:hypothetical protein
MLNVIVLNVNMPNVIMLNVIVLNVIMLNVIMLNVTVPFVAAPFMFCLTVRSNNTYTESITAFTTPFFLHNLRIDPIS